MSEFPGGVVDLGALASATQKTPASGRNGGMAPGAADGAGPSVPGSVDVELTPAIVQTLAENSTRLPVLCVFVSARSPQSAKIAKELVALARESGGRFQVARGDVDTHPEFVQAFGLRGVPAVVAMLQGQLAPLFEGAPADGELARIVNQVLAAAAQNGLTGTVAVDGDGGEPAEPPLPPHHGEAQAALDAGDLATARAEFEAALRENPGDSFASTGIAQVSMLERLSGASIPALLSAGENAPLGDVEAQLDYADALVAVGNVDGCFARLVDVVKATSGDEREAVRVRLVELFDIVGGTDPRVMEARRALASALF